MASRSSATPTPRSGPSVRMLAAAACLLAIALLAWRGHAVLTAPQSAPAAGPFETSLLSVIEPVAGPGLVRLSVTQNAAGQRNILILLDRSASAQAETIRRIATSAAGIAATSGDTLIIEQASFAAGIPGRASPEAVAELALMGVLASLLGWMTLTAQPARVPEAELVATSLPARRAPAEAEPARRPAPVPSALPQDASVAARKDPAKAADILRGWMNDKGEAA